MDSEKGMLDIRERLIKIETMLENQSKTSDLKLDTYSEKLKVANQKISDIEDNIAWLWRTSLGAIITCAIAIIFRFF